LGGALNFRIRDFQLELGGRGEYIFWFGIDLWFDFL